MAQRRHNRLFRPPNLLENRPPESRIPETLKILGKPQQAEASRLGWNRNLQNREPDRKFQRTGNRQSNLADARNPADGRQYSVQFQIRAQRFRWNSKRLERKILRPRR